MEEKKLNSEAIVKALEKSSFRGKFDGEAIYNAISLIYKLEENNYRQKAEIQRLKDEKEEIRLFNLALQNGEIDMRIESEMAKSFYNSIVQVFEQNGAKNFFTTTIDIEGKNGRYAFTIEKVGGQTVAEILADQKAEIERLTEELNKQRNLYLKEFGSNANALAKNAELQSEVDKLKERNYWLESEHEYQCEKSYFEGVEKGKGQAVKDTAIKCLTDIEDCINGMLDGERYMTKNEVEYLLEHILNKKQEYGAEVE